MTLRVEDIITAPPICAKCRTRPGTEFWTEGSIAFVHGAYQRWCKVCVLSTQLEFARELAAQIPALEAELENVRKT